MVVGFAMAHLSLLRAVFGASRESVRSCLLPLVSVKSTAKVRESEDCGESGRLNARISQQSNFCTAGSCCECLLKPRNGCGRFALLRFVPQLDISRNTPSMLLSWQIS